MQTLFYNLVLLSGIFFLTKTATEYAFDLKDKTQKDSVECSSVNKYPYDWESI